MYAKLIFNALITVGLAFLLADLSEHHTAWQIIVAVMLFSSMISIADEVDEISKIKKDAVRAKTKEMK